MLGSSEGAKLVIKALKQLQNRGYDSAGIASLNNGSFTVRKWASKNASAIEKLENQLDVFENHELVIGHTRWATHGECIDANSHPHLDMLGEFCIVHNGIIENYEDLKNGLLSGFTFKSTTDSEVVANLLLYTKHKNPTASIGDIICSACDKLLGTYALIILHCDTPDVMFCIKRGSPMLICKSLGMTIVASEISGLLNGSNYISINNNDLCTIRKEKIKTSSFYSSMAFIPMLMGTPDPYNHWMEKEIMLQGTTFKSAINNGARISNGKVKLGGLDANVEKLGKIRHIILLGCGTSFNACAVARSRFVELCVFDSVSVYDASDFDSSRFIGGGINGVILVSQSGETMDLHKCLEIIGDNVVTLGVVNVVDSMIARDVACGVHMNAGREVAVASTKVFLSEVVILTLIAMWFSQLHDVHEDIRELYIEDLDCMEHKINECINNLHKIEPLIKIIDRRSIFLLGMGKGYPIAAEGSLKIKEVSRIHSEAYTATTLKHGPFALIDKGFPIILVDPKCGCPRRMENTYHEVTTRGAVTITITDMDLQRPNIFKLPHTKVFGDLLAIIPLQYLAYKLSIREKLNPDYPCNLAKVVTVE